MTMTAMTGERTGGSGGAKQRGAVRRCRCDQCVELRSRTATLPVRLKGKGATRHGDLPHHSGSVAHWDERDKENPHWYLLVTCFNCGHDKFVHKQTLLNPSWHGLCPDCLKQHGSLTRRIGDEVTPSGAIIHWDERDPNDSGRALVTCSKCRINKEMMVVSSGNKKTSKFYCKTCRRDEGSARLNALWGAAKGNVEKRGRGRIPKPPEVKKTEIDRRKAEFENKVRLLGEKYEPHEIIRSVIADEYADENGEIPDDSTVSKWVLEFYGRGVSVPAAVRQILAGSRVNTDFDRENKSLN